MVEFQADLTGNRLSPLEGPARVSPQRRMRWPKTKVALRTISEDVDSNGFTVAPDGFLYGASYDDVIKVDLTTGTFETLVDGFFYRVSLDGSSIELFATLSEQYLADNFAIAKDGTFLVTRFNDPIITRVSVDGLTVEDFSIGE